MCIVHVPRVEQVQCMVGSMMRPICYTYVRLQQKHTKTAPVGFSSMCTVYDWHNEIGNYACFLDSILTMTMTMTMIMIMTMITDLLNIIVAMNCYERAQALHAI